jgi:hypothetical protein
MQNSGATRREQVELCDQWRALDFESGSPG